MISKEMCSHIKEYFVLNSTRKRIIPNIHFQDHKMNEFRYDFKYLGL